MMTGKLIGYIAAVLAVFGLLWSYGHERYAAGRQAEKAVWTVQLIATQKALAEANAKTRTLEQAARDISADVEAQHATTIADLNARAADADRRFRALSVRLAANSTRCESVPAVPRTPAVPDAASAGESRADGVGAAIADVGRRCESDAATLGDLQEWVRRQVALRSQ